MSLLLRPAEAGDVITLEEIVLAADAPPATTAVEIRTDLTGVHVPYLTHLIGRGRVVVAERAGVAVGFGAAVDTGRARHLADLFVVPEHQGSGIGRQLLDAVYGDAWPRTTFASDDPRALPLYLRAGMAALWPNLYLAGDPRRLPPDPEDLTADIATVATVASRQAEWLGVDRTPDLAYWASRDVRPVVVRRGGRVVGAGIGRARSTGPGRWIHTAAAAPDEDGPTVLLAVMRAALTGADVTVVGGCVPGPSPLVQRLLGAGFRIADRDTFLASDPTIVDPLREIVDTGVL